MDILPLNIFEDLRDLLSLCHYARLLNSTKKLKNIKFETIRYKVRGNEVNRFFSDPKYQTHILEKIRSPENQLGFECKVVKDLAVLERILNFKSWKLVLLFCHIEKLRSWKERLSGRYSLTLTGNEEIIDLDGLSDVVTLEINDFFDLYSVNYLSNITSLREVKLSNCSEVIDVSGLGFLSKLTLRDCPKINDVSNLGYVNDLTLWNCVNIQDISALTNNKTLCIISCPHIDKSTRNFRNVINLHTDLIDTFEASQDLLYLEDLSLERFKGEDIFLSSSLKSIFLSSSSIHTLHSFSHLRKACLEYLSPKVSLDPLKNVPVVEIWSSEIVDISGLGNNRRVTLDDCQKIVDFSALKNVPNVTITNCHGFQNGYELIGVKDIKISSCPKLEDVSMWSQATSVSLAFCINVISLRGLGNVNSIRVHGCSIDSYEDLTNVSKITIEKELKEVLQTTLPHFYDFQEYESTTEFLYLRTNQ